MKPDQPERNSTANAPSAPPSRNLVAAVDQSRQQLRWFACFVFGLSLAFALPLFGLVRYSFTSGLNSHIILIPGITFYLVWLRRQEPRPAISGSPALALIPLALALVGLKAVLCPGETAGSRTPEDYYALTTFCYLALGWAGALWFLGGKFLIHFLFPAAFLTFMLPMPSAVRHGVEVFFQHTSADAAAMLFGMSGSTVFRDGLVFQLPGITLQVAEECSGIRSSYVLFITSLLAGYMFLRSPWRRTSLALFVIPLAILRNGFRVFTLGWLCVHVNPAMIDSPIHHRGGPLFFLLSLIPFFLILYWLWRAERRATPFGGPVSDVQSPGNSTL
ncbi:MAG: archaeosortase/exosortase family protein [Verrucomicrobia subdivision 3 bacterium]|nr:archaeosortase/exosortase family protein [Limisphaerales bacterium]